MTPSPVTVQVAPRCEDGRHAFAFEQAPWTSSVTEWLLPAACVCGRWYGYRFEKGRATYTRSEALRGTTP